jgi:hypothetical protein
MSSSFRLATKSPSARYERSTVEAFLERRARDLHRVGDAEYDGRREL